MKLRLYYLNSPEMSEMTSVAAAALKDLSGTAGWAVFQQHLQHQTEEVSDFLLASERHEDFLYRKGFLDGHQRTRDLLSTLITTGEVGDEEWLRNQMEAAGKLLGLRLTQGLAPDLERLGQERANRVRVRVEAERAKEKAST